jgi:endo-1,4-beta-xylanase
MTKRRSFIKQLSLLSALPFLGKLNADAMGNALSADQIKKLSDLAKAKNLFYGTAVNDSVFTNPALNALVAAQCNIIVCENAMKWAALRPAADVFDFSKADAYVDFAVKNNMLIRGHNLCWHQSTPKWLDGYLNHDNAEKILTEHVEKVVQHYSGKMQSWDVVNEAIDIKAGEQNGFRTKSVWYEFLGEDFVEIAFKAAAKHDNHALLMYNDYDLETNSDKRRKVLDLIERLKTKGIRIDGLGTQAHLGSNFSKNFSADGYRQFLSDAAKMGLKITVTELDVNDQKLPADTNNRDNIVAQVYHDFLDVALRHPAVNGFLTWGIADKGSWINHNYAREDKLPSRPLLFDDALQPKAVFNAVADVLQKLS